MHSSNSIQIKKCHKCLIDKSINDYSKDSRQKDGLRYQCRPCAAKEKREYRLRKPDIDKIYRKTWIEKNKEHIKEYDKNYRKTKASEINARNAKRKASKKQRTPKWITEDQLKEIKKFYKWAHTKSLTTNQKWHVDHIIPMNGKTVSGLHVPWNLQVITAKENIAKANKYDE
jgi:hypothetical protein